MPRGKLHEICSWQPASNSSCALSTLLCTSPTYIISVLFPRTCYTVASLLLLRPRPVRIVSNGQSPPASVVIQQKFTHILHFAHLRADRYRVKTRGLHFSGHIGQEPAMTNKAASIRSTTYCLCRILIHSLIGSFPGLNNLLDANAMQ